MSLGFGLEPTYVPICAAGGEFIAFRILAKDVSCDEAAVVVKGAVENAPPAGWTCQRVASDFVSCTNAAASVGFND